MLTDGTIVMKARSVLVAFGAVAVLLFFASRLIESPTDSGDKSKLDSKDSSRGQEFTERSATALGPSLEPARQTSNETVEGARTANQVRKWGELSLNMRLSEVFAAAKRELDSDDRAVAVHLSSQCIALQAIPLSREAVAYRISSDAAVQRTFDAAMVSRRILSDYCAEGGYVEFLESAKATRFATGKLYRQMTAVRQRDQSGNEYLQAVVQVLSNPQKYQLHFDMWLENRLPILLRAQSGFSDAQIWIIQNELAGRFIGGAAGMELRDVLRCAVQYICKSAVVLTDTEKSAALNTAAELEMRIRTQRWNAL